MKLILLIVAVYLGYRVLRAWIYGSVSRHRFPSDAAHGQIDDVMVKDPVCEVFFPKKEGVRAQVDGEEIYFCSARCKEKFFENRKGD